MNSSTPTERKILIRACNRVGAVARFFIIPIMDLEDLFYAIRSNCEYYQIKNYAIDFGKISCTISTNNLNKIIDYHFSMTNQKRPEKVSEFTIYGIRIFPSDFISDNEILIGEIKNLKDE